MDNETISLCPERYSKLYSVCFTFTDINRGTQGPVLFNCCIQHSLQRWMKTMFQLSLELQALPRYLLQSAQQQKHGFIFHELLCKVFLTSKGITIH